jgi:hypothetical protein
MKKKENDSASHLRLEAVLESQSCIPFIFDYI